MHLEFFRDTERRTQERRGQSQGRFAERRADLRSRPALVWRSTGYSRCLYIQYYMYNALPSAVPCYLKYQYSCAILSLRSLTARSRGVPRRARSEKMVNASIEDIRYRLFNVLALFCVNAEISRPLFASCAHRRQAPAGRRGALRACELCAVWDTCAGYVRTRLIGCIIL